MYELGVYETSEVERKNRDEWLRGSVRGRGEYREGIYFVGNEVDLVFLTEAQVGFDCRLRLLSCQLS